MSARAMGSHQSARAKTTTWLTPPELIQALGPFDLDPCASPYSGGGSKIVYEEAEHAARAALVAAQGAAPQAESVSKSSYISPSLPAQIRGLYRADLRERSIQTMLDLAGDLIQELIDLKAAPVLPSSGVDEDKLAEVIAKSRGFGNGWEQIPPLTREAYREVARAVAEWLKGQKR